MTMMYLDFSDNILFLIIFSILFTRLFENVSILLGENNVNYYLQGR